MKNLYFRVIVAFCVFTLFTLPHFIYMQTGGEKGISYSLGGILLCSLISIIVTSLIAGKFEE